MQRLKLLHKALNMSTPRITRSASRKSTDGASVTVAPATPAGAKPKKNASVSNKAAAAKKQKATDQENGTKVPSKRTQMKPPETPPAKKSKKNATVTPAPSYTLGLHSTGDIDDAIPLLSGKERPAEPNMTNAPLITPRGSRLVAYTQETADISPSKSGAPRATTTTGNLLEEACAHLIKVDPRMEPLVKEFHCHVFSPEGLAEDVDPFRSLCSGIMAQQVSGAAASSIKKKFIRLFNSEAGEGDDESQWAFPTPEVVAKAEIPFLRQAGLSERKAEYIKGLAGKFASGELSAKMLIDATYEEVLEKLIAVRGLGQWSVEMFACFALKRMDVFSTGDLGIQ